MDELKNVQEIENIPNQIVIVTYRLEQNKEFIPAEEILLESFLKIAKEKFEIVTYHSQEITSFLGKLPCLYINKNIILNKDIPNFIYNSVNEDSLESTESKNDDQLKVFENILFICKEELRPNNEYYSYLKQKAKYERSKGILSYFTRNFSKNSYYEHIMAESLKNYDYTNPMNSCINNIKDAYFRLNILKGNDFNLSDQNSNFPNNKLLVIGLLLYAFLKEDRLMFEEIKRPEIENLKYEQNNIILSLENFFTKVDRLYYNIPNKKISHGLILYKEKLLSLLKKYGMNFDPISSKEKNKKQKEVSEIQNANQWRYNLISIFVFLGVGAIFWYLSTRKDDKINSNQLNIKEIGEKISDRTF